MFKILVVEDDVDLNRAMCKYLTANGYRTTGCNNAEDAFEAISKNVFDIIISDIMMPHTDGFDFTETVRTTQKEIPILFVTARDDIYSKKTAFGVGADDYMVKPIDFDELLLRVNALLRRAKIANSHKITVGRFEMNITEYSAYNNGVEIPLTVREFNILYKLLSYPKRTFSRQELLSEFWRDDSDTGLRTIDVYMTKLRAKLAECTDFEIVTVRGLGYKAVLK